LTRSSTETTTSDAMPEDWMDPETWWPKRYLFTTANVRRSYYSIYIAGAATNFGTHQLYNSSTGDRVLVVRSFSLNGTSNASQAAVLTQQGALGTHAGAEYPVWAGERQSAGQHWYVDNASKLTVEYFLVPAANYQFITNINAPLAVLPPGWSFIAQANATAQTTKAQFIWEELRIDDPILGTIGDVG
jgi:hypothetical protein